MLQLTHSLTHSLTLSSLAAPLAVLLAASSVPAQVNFLSDGINFRTSGQQSQTTQHYGNLKVDGVTSTTGALEVANNYAGSGSYIRGVRASAATTAGYGSGGYFTGGRHGVLAEAIMGGSGTRYGGLFYGGGSTGNNYGLYASASGPAGSTTYGVFGNASGGLNNWAGYFTGQISVSGQVYPSDGKLKLNEAKLVGALPRLMQLQPRTYQYDTAAYRDMNLPAGNQMGLVAQEVETVFPELVTQVTAPVPPDKPDAEPITFKGMNYTGLIPVLIAAVQEQEAEIKALRERIDRLENVKKW